MNALKPKHELFAQRVAAGDEAGDAYAACFPKAARRSAKSAGPRLLANVVVRARVAELQAASATALTLTMQERREMLARVARESDMTPLHLASVLRIDAELAGELIRREEVTDTTPREPLEVVKARIAASKARQAAEQGLRVVPREDSAGAA